MLGWQMTTTYSRMLKLLRADPLPLAHAIAAAIQAEKSSTQADKLGFDRRQTDSVARAIVHDLFGPLHERQCLQMLVRLLTLLHSDTADKEREHKPAGSSVLEFNSFSLKLLQEYNQVSEQPLLYRRESLHVTMLVSVCRWLGASSCRI